MISVSLYRMSGTRWILVESQRRIDLVILKKTVRPGLHYSTVHWYSKLAI